MHQSKDQRLSEREEPVKMLHQVHFFRDFYLLTQKAPSFSEIAEIVDFLKPFPFVFVCGEAFKLNVKNFIH